MASFGTKAVCCVFVCTLVTACGGGGASSSTNKLPLRSNPTLDKYAGNWASDCEITTGGSEKEDVIYTKVSDDTLNASSSVKVYTTKNCTGPFTTTAYSGSLRFDGTKGVGVNANGPIVADKVTITLPDGSVFKDIYWVFQNGTFRNEIYTGNVDAGGSVDAEGFPNSLEIAPTQSRPI
jgi:hypothetical protein